MTSKTLPLAIGVFLLAGFVHVAPLAAGQDAPTYAVTGVVKNDQGDPIPGAYVYGWTSPEDGGAQSYDKTVADEDGAFTLHLAPGKGQVSAHADGHREGAAVDVLVDEDGLDGVALTLPTPPPRNALVEGTVLDEDGDPIAGATVILQQSCCHLLDARGGGTEPAIGEAPPSPEESNATYGSPGPDAKISRPIWYDGDHQTTTTDADGKYAFKSYAGLRQVTASAKGYAQVTKEIEAVDGETVKADLTLVKVPDADARLVVKVVDAKTGLPLEGASVSLQNAEWSRYAWQATGKDGRATLTTIPGWIVLNVNHHDYGIAVDTATSDSRIAPPGGGKPYYQFVKAFRIESGQTTLDVELEPKPEPTVVVTGYVVDPEAKKGVPNAWINVWNMDTGDWGNAQTDATGSYRLVLRPGHYTIHAWADGHYPGAGTFLIGEAEKAKRVDVDAPKGDVKHAPCEDADCYGGVTPMMAEKDSAAAGGATLRSTGAPAMGDASTQELSTASPPNGADTTRAAAYQGSGGGLPPYDAGAAPAAQDTQQVSGAQKVPLPGALLLVGAAALVAVLLRRRA